MSKDIDPKRVTAAGSGVDNGVTAQNCRFQIQGLKGKIQLLSLAIDGPSQPNFEREVDEDGNINCSYVPTLPGEYTVSVKASEKHIKGSPFKVEVIGTCPFSRCSNNLVLNFVIKIFDRPLS